MCVVAVGRNVTDAAARAHGGKAAFTLSTTPVYCHKQSRRLHISLLRLSKHVKI